MTGPIAYLTGEYPRATDTFIQREVAALRAQGLEVHTATIRATDPAHHVGPEQRAEADATFPVLRMAKNPFRLFRAHLSCLLHNPGGWVRAMGLARRTCAPGLKAALWQVFYFLEAGVLAQHLRNRDVVHLHNHFADSSCTVAMLSAEMADLPFSLTLHGPGIFFEPIRWRIDEKIARAAFVACISHFCRSQAMLFSEPTHWSKLRIVHCGVDPDKYGQKTGQDARRSYHRRLLFIGRLAAVKGVPLLLEAAVQLHERFPDLELHVVGDGPDRAALAAQSDTVGLTGVVTFHGYCSQDEVADLLAETDILVLPSFAEGIPVTLMEAMAARLPVVATQVGGVSELVETDRSGFVCPPGDVDTLTARIATLLEDPDLCAELGEAGRKKVVADFASDAEALWLAQLIKGSLSGTLPEGLRPGT